ncbi:MAG: bifunctional glutamate N-acetyltransferase/amino-acid acetyltransferase ArgJ, partial [Alphaproteobacteria bacterium]|nr:bifunctional glutamate N-acetyltransferase/amino-acid acetyltransferase ArgJ [Alphaproteobacteria bacterium]
MAKKFKKSPLAPDAFPSLPNIRGIRLSAIHSGIRYRDKLDLSLITMDEKTNVACVLTKSSTPSAPVIWCKKIKNYGKARALIVNSGNANAHTGEKGLKTVKDTVDYVAKYLGCKNNEVYVCSTGVIGEFLKTDIITSSIPILIEQKPSSWKEVAESICTTDTFIKGAKAKCKIDDIAYNILGIAKGSGMIFPNMGTMLAFIFTDFPLSSNILNIVLKEAVEKSFNSITVDGDTSTSDTCLLFSSNIKPLNKPIKSLADRRLKLFRKSLDKVLQSLAQQIVCDGEGASKFITINVNSVKSYKIAKEIALSVANSSLVKTAIAGEDPNWGRVIMAIGKSGVSIRQESISISINKTQITHKGALINNYNEKVV